VESVGALFVGLQFSVYEHDDVDDDDDNDDDEEENTGRVCSIAYL